MLCCWKKHVSLSSQLTNIFIIISCQRNTQIVKIDSWLQTSKNFVEKVSPQEIRTFLIPLCI